MAKEIRRPNLYKVQVAPKVYQSLSRDYKRHDMLYNFRCKPQAKRLASMVTTLIRFSGLSFWDPFSGRTPLADLTFFEHSHSACKGEAALFTLFPRPSDFSFRITAFACRRGGEPARHPRKRQPSVTQESPRRCKSSSPSCSHAVAGVPG